MADTFDAKKWGAIIPIVFQVTNATTQATNVDLAAPGGATVVVMPGAGSIIGISVSATTEVTAGTATFKAHASSTEYGGSPAPVLSTSASGATYATTRPQAITFAAGAAIGVSYSSSTDMAPTNSNDYTAVLWVQLNPV